MTLFSKLSPTVGRLLLPLRSAQGSRSKFGNLQAQARCLGTSFVLREEYIIHSNCPNVEIKKEHFTDYLWKDAVQKHGSKTSFVNGPTGESFTYVEGRRQTDLFAAAMADLGVLGKGDVMAILMTNSPEYIFMFGGATEIGAVVTTINPAYTATEISRQFKMSGTKLVATMEAFLPVVKESLARLEGENAVKIVCVDAKDHSSDGSVLSYSKLMSEASTEGFKRADFDFDDLIFLPYSSGTTGVPKGVMLSHKNIVANGRQCIYAEGYGFVPFATETYQPSTLCVMPMFHVFGSAVTSFTTLHPGGKVITLPNFDPAAFVKYLEEYRPTFLHFAPPLVGFCAMHPMVTPDHLSSVEFIMVGAAPVGEALINLFHKKAPHVNFREGWGMTETSPIGMMTPTGKTVPGSCGLAVPNTELKIVDLETRESLPPNKRGELCLRGPQVMRGYLDNPEATAKTVSPDGWLMTGDIAYYDENKYIFMVDRLKELIKVKGFQVPPAELEDLLRSHPSIQDVAVIGIPHDKMGEAPRAYVVLTEKDALTEEQVHEFVNKEVAEYKRLSGGIQFIEAVPKSAAGKILRKDLVAQWKKENGKE